MMIANDPIHLMEIIDRLKEEPESVPFRQRLELATQLEDAIGGWGPSMPKAVSKPLAHVIAADPSSQVRKRVANVLHLLEDEDFEALWPILAEDSNGYVARAAELANIRRRKARRHENHVRRIMSEVAKLSHEFAEGKEDVSPISEGPALTAVAVQDVLTLDEFMRKYCRSTAGIESKRQFILNAARHGQTSLPPLARPHRRGQRYYFHARDLLAIWPHWLADGMPLPALR